jgi:acyl-CoA reductase-like NAD-dependent aldehyde dehydrogenase
MNDIAEVAQKAFLEWRKVPVPQRVRTMFEYRERLTKNLDKIAEVITLEVLSDSNTFCHPISFAYIEAWKD